MNCTRFTQFYEKSALIFLDRDGRKRSVQHTNATLLSITGRKGFLVFFNVLEGGTNENNKRFLENEAAG